MGTIKKGILGGFSGKVGTVIGYQVRGKSFIRGLAKTASSQPSAKQLANYGKLQVGDFNYWLVTQQPRKK